MIKAILKAILIVFGIYVFSCFAYYIFSDEHMFYIVVSILAVAFLARALYETGNK